MFHVEHKVALFWMFHVKLYGVAWEFHKGLVRRVVLNVSRGTQGGELF